jgi:hypothetical protein
MRGSRIDDRRAHRAVWETSEGGFHRPGREIGMRSGVALADAVSKEFIFQVSFEARAGGVAYIDSDAGMQR